MRPSSRRSMLRGAIVVAVLSTGSSAWSAGPSAQDRAFAEALFREGKGLVDAGKVAEACPKFVESQRLDPKLGTLMYAATCHEESGKTATAWVEWTEAISLAQHVRAADREKLARQHAAKLEAKLPHLRVKVPADAKDLVVKLDEEVVRPAMYGSALPLDPGEHVVSASAPGKKAFASKVQVADGGEVQLVEIPTLEPEVVAVAPPPPPVPPPAPPPPPTGPAHPALGYALGGLGLVALGAGTFFGLQASSQKGDADQMCPGQLCPTQAGVDEHAAASTSATISTAAFAVGIAATGAAVYFLFFDKGKPKTVGAAGVEVTPWGVRF